jgi:hypothetical protein
MQTNELEHFSIGKARSLDSSELILDWKYYVKDWEKMRRAEFTSKTKII